MDWANERWVRIYTRDTGDWLALSWDAQALFMQLARKVDRAGVLDLGRQGTKTVAVVLGQVALWASRLAPALAELLADGCVVERGGVLVIPNFVAAQEAAQSDRLRQAEARARRRESAMRGEKGSRAVGVTERESRVTERDHESRSVTPASRAVTARHAASRDVTPSETSDPSETGAASPEPFRLVPPEPFQAPDHSRFVACFDALYRERTGKGATWRPKEHGQAAGLLKAHGLAECCKRAERMFHAPPAWLAKGGGVSDLGTLVSNFDKLAEPVAPPKPEPVDPDVVALVDGDRWAQQTNLAEREAELEARGRPIPWLKNPLRARMTQDAGAHPLKPVAVNGRGGNHP